MTCCELYNCWSWNKEGEMRVWSDTNRDYILLDNFIDPSYTIEDIEKTKVKSFMELGDKVLFIKVE